MAKKVVLVKPMLTEKSEYLSENLNKYSFVVNKKANKLEIKKAVEDMYQVSVESVNTAIMPSRTKSRNTKSGLIRGRVSSYKKAVITLSEGEELDFFGDI